MAAIDVSDVAAAVGYPISDADDVAQVETWIDDVEMILAARIGDLSLLNQPLLRYVEREAVVSRMKYRDDKNSEAGQSGGTNSNFFLGVLADWWELLQVPAPRSVGAFSVLPS